MGRNYMENVEYLLKHGVTRTDVEQMAHNQKLAYIQQMQKVLESLRKNKLDTYNKVKIHKKQVEFHKCKKRKRCMLGGNRTGKTVSGAVEAVWTATGLHPYRNIDYVTDGWVVSLTNEVQRDVAQKEVLKWLNPDLIIDYGVRDGTKADIANCILDYILVKHKGGGTSKIGFKTCEQGRAKFQGTSKNYIWFDEEPPKEIYDECLMRIMDVRGDIWLTMTPLMGLTFVYDMYYINENDDKEVQTIIMEWADNPYLSEDEIQYMIETLPADERIARQKGLFVALSGLVYKEFDPSIHVLNAMYDLEDRLIWIVDDKGEKLSPIRREWYDKIAIDVGFTNPTSIHFYACDNDGTVYVLAEIYKTQTLVKEHASHIHRIAKRLGWPRTNGGIMGVIDTNANNATSTGEKTVRQQYAEEKVYTSNAKKSVYAGIQEVKKYLALDKRLASDTYPDGKPKFYILNVDNWEYNNTEMVKEIKKYRWGEQDRKKSKNGPEEPKKLNDHAMDELKYYIMSGPAPAYITQEIDGDDTYRSELEIEDERKERRLKTVTIRMGPIKPKGKVKK